MNRFHVHGDAIAAECVGLAQSLFVLQRVQSFVDFLEFLDSNQDVRDEPIRRRQRKISIDDRIFVFHKIKNRPNNLVGIAHFIDGAQPQQRFAWPDEIAHFLTSKAIFQ